MTFKKLIQKVSKIFYGNHGWENRHGTNYPTDTLADLIKSLMRKLRVDLCFDEHDGFDVGVFVGTWKRARGPFLLYREYLNESAMAADTQGDPTAYGPWRLMVALSKDAWDGFDDGAGK